MLCRVIAPLLQCARIIDKTFSAFNMQLRLDSFPLCNYRLILRLISNSFRYFTGGNKHSSEFDEEFTFTDLILLLNGSNRTENVWPHFRNASVLKRRGLSSVSPYLLQVTFSCKKKNTCYFFQRYQASV